MSQPSLSPRQSTPPVQSGSPSLKSGKQTLGKSLKNAFSRRKRSGSFRSGDNDSDYSVSSQRSRSIGPESFISNEPSETRISEDAMLDSREYRYASRKGTIFPHVPTLLYRFDDLTFIS